MQVQFSSLLKTSPSRLSKLTPHFCQISFSDKVHEDTKLFPKKKQQKLFLTFKFAQLDIITHITPIIIQSNTLSCPIIAWITSSCWLIFKSDQITTKATKKIKKTILCHSPITITHIHYSTSYFAIYILISIRTLHILQL